MLPREIIGAFDLFFFYSVIDVLISFQFDSLKFRAKLNDCLNHLTITIIIIVVVYFIHVHTYYYLIFPNIELVAPKVNHVL